jgi:hypothetical protein
MIAPSVAEVTLEDEGNGAQRQLRAAQRLERIAVQNRAKVGCLVAKSGHLGPAVPQKRQKAGGVRGHGLEIEGHFLLAQTCPLQRVDVQLQCFRPRQPSELVGRDAHSRGDILEEIRHRPAAGLEEIPDPVVHVFQDIGELLLLDPNRARASRPALQGLRCRIGDLRELPDLGGTLGGGSDDQPERGSRGGSGGPEGKPRPACEGRKPRIRQFHLARQAAKATGTGFADALQFRAHAPSALRDEADGDFLFGHGGILDFCITT